MSASATVKGGLYETQGLSTLAQVQGTNALRRRIAMLFGRKSLLALRELAVTLDGVAAGQAASKTYSRIEANSELGGARTIESQALVNRNTAAADVTEINADILTYTTRTTFGSSPPANLDGNPLGTR